MGYRFKCTTCDLWHEGLPVMGFDRPLIAQGLPEEEEAKRLFLNSDLCVVDDKYFFVRCTLQIPIKGIDDIFGWGIWSSLSDTNFFRYQKHQNEDRSGWDPMFGYLSNRLPEYPDTLNLKLSVQPGGKGDRPTVLLEPTDHPLSLAQRDGMSLELALKIAGPYLH
jgi:hypothetical protein